MKSVNSDNTSLGASVPMPGVPGGGLAPEARRPLRELMGDRLRTRCWSGRGTRPGGCG
jgi:hypothetical protein